MNTVPDKDPSLRDFLKTFDRRRRLVLGVAGTIFLLAVLASIVTTRRYTASSVIELRKVAASSPGLDALMGGETSAADAMALNVELQTQSDILQSDALALRVIKQLDLEQTSDFKPHFSPVGWVLSLFAPKGPSDPSNASLENSPGRRRVALATFHNNLKVRVNAGTRLTEIDYTNRDPKVASDVVNRLVEALVDYNFESRLSATNEVSRGLEGQLSDLRKHSEELQAKVVGLKQGSGLFGVGGVDASGQTQVSSPVLQNLDKSTAQLSAATMNRVLKQAVYDVVRSGDPEAISQLSGTQMSADGAQGVTNSLGLIQSLRTQESALSSQIDQESTKFGPAYPRLIQDKASLKSVQQSLQDEISRIGIRAKTDYEVAQRAEDGARAAYEADRSAAGKLNDQGIEFGIVSKEADQSQQLYQDLLKRLTEAGVVEGLHSSSVTVLDPATPPATPSKPNVPLYLFMGVFLGLFLGACAAVVADFLDTTIQGTDEIEAMQLPLIGLVPQIKLDAVAPGGFLQDSNYSVFGEAVRGLRSTLLEAHTGKQVQVLVVTSSSPREGKSALALNLAVSQSQFNKKVLLVEGDMRRPVLRKILGLPGTDGLSDLLSDPKSTVSPQPLAQHPNLHCLPSGPVPAYPAELLASERMQFLMREWRRTYDFIVVDCPPVLPVTDTQYLEGLADATFLVVRAGATSKIALNRSYQLLLRHAKDQANPKIGVVLNFISLRSAAYYGYYGYHGDSKYEYEKVGSSEKD